MSALTKLFVILLIVCSMLLTAGVVVFVNRTEDYKKAWTDLQAANRTLQTEKEAAEVLARAAQSREQANAIQLNGKISELQTTITSLNDKISGLGTSGNSDKTTIALLTAQLDNTASAQKTLTQALQELQTRYDTMVKQNGEDKVRNTELFGANTDLQKKNETADREIRFQNEQIVQLKAKLQAAETALIALGGDPNKPVRGPRLAPAVNGVVTSVRREGGITLAVISLGAADRIDKGMQFNITDAAGQNFLGLITIDTVESNESAGRVEGPRTAEIQKDCKVMPSR